MRSKLTASIALTVCLGLLLAGTAIAGSLAPTQVTIKEQNGDFHGKVISEEADCVVDRKVTVFKKREGPDLKINSDNADDEGKWNTGNTHVGHGTYYAKAKEVLFTMKRGFTGCEKDKSPTVTVN